MKRFGKTRWSVQSRYVLGALFVLLFLMPMPGQAQAKVPRRAYIAGVEGRAQSWNLSCESRSAVDWAAFWGVKISERQFLHRLPRSDNPDKGFVGDPADAWGYIPPNSYGVHAEPVADLLRSYGFDAQARQGVKWEELQREIADERPVIVWVIGQMWKGKSSKYHSEDGGTTRVAPFEHTMILVGYDPERVWVIDAYTGLEQVYALTSFLKSWEVLGRMAITGNLRQLENVPASTPIPPSVTGSPASTQVVYLAIVWAGKPLDAAHSPPPEADKLQRTVRYVVKRGDYLTMVARRLKVDWRELAEVNQLQPPYTIHPGQVLRVP